MTKKDSKVKDIIKNFAPGWFASVMGTGIVAVASYLYADIVPGLKPLAGGLGVLSLILFVLLLIPWTLRWILYRENAVTDLRNPVVGQFYATMPIACLVVSSLLLTMGTDYLGMNLTVLLAKGFWVIGAVIALVCSIVIPLLNIVGQQVKIENIIPAWFMPPVSLIVIPVPGAKLIAHWPTDIQPALLAFNFLSWSSGFFLFILLSAICLYRLFCYPLLPGQLASALWINLGPVGVGTMALLNLAAVTGTTPLGDFYIQSILSLLGFLLWGFGFWWLIMLVCLTLYYIFKRRDLPFTIAWWAFVFPLGAYTAATYLVATFLNIPFLHSYGFVCYVLLLAVWLIVFSRTFIGAVKMELFKPKSIGVGNNF